ncbi:zinc-ribbon domain-containing protein [Streptomyces sp. ATE26]|uniref:zinc-ribbon domain-containing protein n=1 Tax=Streptomyces sp. ATE26 TaxID=2954237 RepID=UPI002482C5B7|nr:zinc-ribbon domain-containing protein [Streptomyces sp. ATE26]MDI1454253.1 zinc-ribbon domain-containing protein [Streptomyces sp. ATE26]
MAQSSGQEIELFTELRAVLVSAGLISASECQHGPHLVEVTARYRRPDMLFGNLIIDYDGKYAHAGREAADHAKATALREVGYSVVRVRQHPLRALHPHDVATPMDDLHAAVCAVLESIATHRLLKGVSASDVRRCLADYWEAATVRSAKEARAAVAARRRQDLGSRSIAARHPELVERWDAAKNEPLTPNMLTPGSNHKVWFRCPQGHSYKQAVSQTVRRGVSCPYCTNKRVGQGNDLAANYPQLASRWHPANEKGPHEVTPGSTYRALWVCEYDHVWEAQCGIVPCPTAAAPAATGKASPAESTQSDIRCEVTHDRDG